MHGDQLSMCNGTKWMVCARVHTLPDDGDVWRVGLWVVRPWGRRCWSVLAYPKGKKKKRLRLVGMHTLSLCTGSAALLCMRYITMHYYLLRMHYKH